MHDQPLPTVTDARRCNSSWDLMKGDDHVRRCTNCNQDVSRGEDGTLTRGDCGDARARVAMLMPVRRMLAMAVWAVCILAVWAAALVAISTKIDQPVYSEDTIDYPDTNL